MVFFVVDIHQNPSGRSDNVQDLMFKKKMLFLDAIASPSSFHPESVSESVSQ